MAFLAPHFDFDVFVSYSQGDPSRMGSELKNWTRKLINDIRDDIQSTDTEFDELAIWYDEKIDPTADLSDTLRAHVRSSGILLIVMSPRYLKSRWCTDELDWFREQIQDRSRDQGRVFVVRGLRTIEGSCARFPSRPARQCANRIWLSRRANRASLRLARHQGRQRRVFQATLDVADRIDGAVERASRTSG